MIEKKVAKVDIPSWLLTSNVGDSSKVDKDVSLKDFFSKRCQRCSLTSSHDVKLPKVAYNINLGPGSYQGQVADLNGDLLVGSMKDCMSM